MSPSDAESHPALGLWCQLLAIGRRRGVRREDAEDLASEAIRKALEAHDPSKGTFSTFCYVVHANLLKNFWRDRKDTAEIRSADNGGQLPLIPPDDGLEILEIRAMIAKMTEEILAILEPDERAFFEALKEVAGEADKVVVSEAARRVGVEPQEGWNIFRRIQRKVSEFRTEYETLRVLLGESAEAWHMRSSAYRAVWACEGGRSLDELEATAGYERFLASLTQEQLQRLTQVLP